MFRILGEGSKLRTIMRQKANSDTQSKEIKVLYCFFYKAFEKTSQNSCFGTFQLRM